MKCPKCEYEQYCPCPSCVDRLPEGMKPWIKYNYDILACAECGFSAHVDWWEEHSMENRHGHSNFGNSALLLDGSGDYLRTAGELMYPNSEAFTFSVPISEYTASSSMTAGEAHYRMRMLGSLPVPGTTTNN